MLVQKTMLAGINRPNSDDVRLQNAFRAGPWGSAALNRNQKITFRQAVQPTQMRSKATPWGVTGDTVESVSQHYMTRMSLSPCSGLPCAAVLLFPGKYKDQDGPSLKGDTVQLRVPQSIYPHNGKKSLSWAHGPMAQYLAYSNCHASMVPEFERIRTV